MFLVPVDYVLSHSLTIWFSKMFTRQNNAFVKPLSRYRRLGRIMK